jgi:mannitol/fructose-specific phosphotransferase system IIA component (Ntr-type)
LGLINQLGDAVLERIGSTLKEVLYENPLTEDVLDYQLFHESFREYLVKEKALKVNEASNRIIDFCASWKDLQGQWEQRYALEHYATHLHESKKEINTEQLLKLIYDSEFQTTQKKVLRGFEASNALFRLALLKASEVKRFDEQLEAGLCLVDLKYEEANDAPQIVAMVANGEIDLALKRIESFGGSDKEGMQRKFTLFMLCLMELTLLDSKDKPFRKEGIEKLLNYLDEQIPPDTSLINWNDFFPSNLMFEMAFEWAEMELDYLIVYRRTEEWDKDWLMEKGPYSDLQLEVLLESARGISGDKEKSSALKDISAELYKQSHLEEARFAMQEALACAGVISDGLRKSRTLALISTELAKQGKVEEASCAMQEAQECALGIEKIIALKDISVELVKQGKTQEASFAMQEALACARGIINDDSKSSALQDICNELVRQGHVEEALACAQGMSDDYWKSRALQSISGELAKQGHKEEATSAIQEALACARGISNGDSKSSALKYICTELAKQGQVEEALVFAQGISDELEKIEALQSISGELAKQGKVEEASSAMQEALACALGIRESYAKRIALQSISCELAKQGKIEEALACAHGISDKTDKFRAIESISDELVEQGKIDEALACARGISDDHLKSRALRTISGELAKQRKFEAASYTIQESLTCTRGIIGGIEEEGRTLLPISRELAKQGNIVEAFAMVRSVSEDFWKSRAVQFISGELSKQGKFEEASSAMRESCKIARGINSYRSKSTALKFISEELANQGKIEEASSVIQEALECARGLSDVCDKSSALKFISDGLAGQGKIEEASFVMQEALACTSGIIDKSDKNMALKDISTGLAKQLNVEEALACARGIIEDYWKSCALNSISSELAKQGKFEKASAVLREALSCARGIIEDYWKSSALQAISGELMRQGQIEEAISYAQSVRDYKALNSISVELAKQGNFVLAEAIGVEIFQISERHNCWKTIAQNGYKNMDWQKSLQQNTQFKSDEARLFYLKGWANSVSECDADLDCVQEALKQLAHDSESIENLLQKHALHEVFFRKSIPEKINRFNQTIDIQWAIDIASQFPKTETKSRLSTNLELWLHEIPDEDDREQIELWAKQVAKGKISEEEFGERVGGLV